MDAAQPGLRLDQAPPLHVPLRFFLTAPLFPVAAALLLAWYGPDALATRWSPVMLALTHLLTLGFVTLVMAGALMQLLPVVAGAPVPRAQSVATVVHILLVPGTVALSAGFLASNGGLLRAGLALLGAGLLVLVGAAAISLTRAQGRSPTVNAMGFALVALTVTLLFGAGLGLVLTLNDSSGRILSSGWTDIHLGWGLVGWIALLVIGVSYQVVPMFQLTPSYPARVRRWLVPVLFVALGAWTLSFYCLSRSAVAAVSLRLSTGAIAFGLAVYALLTLQLQRQRRRRLPDATASFWRLGMGSLLLCLGLWGVGLAGIDFPRRGLLLGALMIVGYAASVIHGMLYKIVPFLVWLHLHSQKIRSVVPSMKDILPDRHTRPHVWLHLASTVLLALAMLAPRWWTYPAAVSIAASFAWLEWNLVSACRLYIRNAQADDRQKTT